MLLRSLRRQLGKTRDQLLHGRRDRRMAAEAAALRDGWAAEAMRALPPLPDPGSSPRIEVHTLCGEAQSAMGIWSTWSLIRFLPGTRLIVHSDGSLSPETAALWREKLPGLRVVETAESDAAMEERLATFGHILDWSRRYHFGRKIGGYYSIARAPRLVEVDTDTLTFTAPEALKAALADDGAGIAWNCDESYCYAYPEPLLRAVAGDLAPDLPERLNTGYMASFRFGDAQWDRLDRLVARFEKDPGTDPLRYWMHQTLIALLAADPAISATPLPAPYNVHKGPTRGDAVMRHYVGNPGIRPRFFTEGIALVIRAARRDGTLDADFFRDRVAD